ncbi:proline-rich receptor-like protein kinase PERK3 [Humulus lupulus]|uniref:proline-rich receptor-like protein kinase PERK3 n=1 Tax=Humulus lupulus TaxID=3486 RepID=UPI002B41695E|nr:proline-rich receptor-like protein kinase PERK3 [Humulus lupulus]
MKSTQCNFSLIVGYLWVAIVFVQCSFSLDDSSSPPLVDAPGICVLNFTQNPYQPTGECLKKDQERIMQWDSFRTTVCCRNAMTALSQALALRTLTQPPANATIFIANDLWKSCTVGPFSRQPSVSADLCGFGGFFYGDSTITGSHCSNLTLQDVKQLKTYQGAVTACNTPYDDFNGACSNCTMALMILRDELVVGSAEKSDQKTETAVCAVAAVVSIVSAILDSSLSTGDLYRCLLLLDKSDPDYLKIKYALAQVLLAIVVGIIGMLLIIALVKYVSKKTKGMKRSESSKEQFPSWSGLYRFSKTEIEKAISFGNYESLGSGSAGHVFKGILPSGQAVAIKHINQNNNEHAESFKREVEGLSRIRHPNLVSLFGFCIEDDCLYLVYEYCSGGNLSHQLLRKNTLLTWDIRVKILRECAIALRYLHHYGDGCIVHRDIKLTNILLTEKLEPKLSDFGLAKLLNVEESRVFTAIRGTIGYMDPEYMSNAKLTCASDIYSFGIVTLQLLAGQRVIELNLVASDQLTRKARDVNLGNRPIEDFEDPRLKGKYNKADFRAILSIAILCVASSSEDRPTIEMVVNEMNKAWKNTDEYKREKKRTKQGSSSNNASAASPSLEVVLG